LGYLSDSDADADLGGRGQDQPVQCWESLVETTVSAITFRERKPSADKEPQYLRLLAQNTEKRAGNGPSAKATHACSPRN
jgi:hypothetical protein